MLTVREQPAPNYDESYTYADFLEWDEDVRAEIIYGKIYMMSTPQTIHQRISGRLFLRFAQFLEGKTCEVFAAPLSVRLFPLEDRSDNTIVVPDLLVICDPSKIDKHGCNGAPDLVIEIVSPSNRRMEKLLKFNLYLKAKVKEYWVVYPEDSQIEVHLFEDGRCYTQIYGVNEPDTKEIERGPEIIPVSVLDGLQIDTKDIFK